MFTFVVRRLLKSTAYFPNPRFGLWLGVGVIVFQYVCELVVMVFAPNLTDTFRLAYLIAAVIVCPAVLLAQAKALQLRNT